MVKKIKNQKKDNKEQNEKKEKKLLKKGNDGSKPIKHNIKIKDKSSFLHENIKKKRENIKKENKKLKTKKKGDKKKKEKEKEKEEEEEKEDDEIEEEDKYFKDIEEEDNEELDEKEDNEEEDFEEESKEEEKEENIKKESEEDEENEDEKDNNNEEKMDDEEEEEKEEKDGKENKDTHEEIKLLSNPINDHYYTFQYPKDLFTLLYTSLIFKWIDTTKLLILCDTPKEGYKIDIFLREFRFNSIYLDKEMPLNTNTHFYNQFLKNNYQICIVNLEYSEKSKNYAKEILENTKIPITIIYFDCFSLELLEYHSFHPNTRAIYHFISNKDLFLDNYEKLNEDINFNEFNFDKEQMEHLRYRAEDILNGIRKSDIKKEKMRKINIELLHSKNMEKFFKENPKEKETVIRTIQENTIKNYRPSVTFLPSYLVHNENNVIADAIKKQYKDKPSHNKRRRNKKGKMEQYFDALDKGDGSQNLIKF